MSGNPIRRVALRNLAAHKVRLALTVLSVVLGTAFITGSFVFTDTLQRTFDGIFGDVAQGVDVRVSTEQYGTSGVPIEAVDQVAALPGVERTSPSIGGGIIVLDSEGAAIQTGGAPAEATPTSRPTVSSANRRPSWPVDRRRRAVRSRSTRARPNAVISRSATARPCSPSRRAWCR